MKVIEETIGGRISKILALKNLKKVDFARTLNIDSSYVTQLIKGRNNPSVRLIEDICEKFNISEEWLRTGKGNMSIELSRNQVLAEWSAKLIVDDPESSFMRKFVEVLIQLDTDDWKTLEKIATMLAQKKD